MDTNLINAIVQKANLSGRSPIWYGSVDYSIKINRKMYPYKAENIVMKGTKEQILKQDCVKRSVLLSHFKGDSAAKKKARAFDLDKITLNNVTFKKSLGYGIKC